MNVPNPRTCDDRPIDRFLDGRLPPEEQSALEDHLATCPACRERVTAAADDDPNWAEAILQLRDDEWDVAAGDRLSSADESPAGDVTRPPGAGDPASQITHWFSPTDDPRMLGRFGEYEIAGVVGSGGMGVVLKGFDRALNRYAAIKVLAPHLATSAAARRRFSRESQAAAAVVHDNVVAIHGVSEWNGLPYLVMPYVRGVSLQKRLDRDGPLSLAEILRIGMQTAAGLAAAHAQGLVHRDVKPANILLEPGVERVKLTDFGLARAADDASLTRSGVIAGTPQYMSPEQARGDETDGRSDLFSLGSVMYAMCTGRPPFRAETSYGILRRITDEEPRPIRELSPETPEWLVAIIQKLHAKHPAERYATADEVARLLEDCLAHVQQPRQVALPQSLVNAQRRLPRNRRWPQWIGRGALVVFLGGLLLFFLANERSRSPSAPNAPDEAKPATADGVDSPPADLPGPLWRDGVDDALRQVREQVEQLDVRSESFWSPIPNDSLPQSPVNDDASELHSAPGEETNP